MLCRVIRGGHACGGELDAREGRALRFVTSAGESDPLPTCNKCGVVADKTGIPVALRRGDKVYHFVVEDGVPILEE